MTDSQQTPEIDLRQIIQSAVNSAVPCQDWHKFLPEPPQRRCIVIGAGKAAAMMAEVIDELWSDIELSGIVSTRYEHAVNGDRTSGGRIEVIEAGHPVPDENSILAAERMLELLHGLTEDDLVLALISGGGSATCALPIDGVSLAQKQSVTKALLHSGATITEMNAVRKALSKVKGGGLARAALPAKVHTLLISDVPGDVPEDVASGPTILTSNSARKAIEVLTRYQIGTELIELIKANTQATANQEERVTFEVVSKPLSALRVAADKAKALGYTPIILSDEIEGESRELGKFLSAIAKSVKKHNIPISRPAAIISGGETTVSIGNSTPGKGGRNTEFLLSFAHEIAGEPDIYAAAVDSDGIDGSEDAAGAVYTPESFLKAQRQELESGDYLQKHDSYSYFEALGDLIISGPSYTNVNDIRIILIR